MFGRQKKEAPTKRGKARGSSVSRSRSNSFVLSQVFDETIERESRKKDTPTHILGRNGEDDILKLQDVEYDFGSEW